MNKFRMVSLQSGSVGNCYFVESGDVRLLLDAGITATRTVDRLASIGVDITTIQGIVISHAHSDHINGTGVLHRRYNIPVWMTNGTYQHATTTSNIARKLGRLNEPHLFHARETLQFGTLALETISTPHDVPDSVCFVLDNGTSRLGIMTDLGCRFLGLDGIIATLDGVLLESNYDKEMLETGPYPEELKQRIRSDSGHLSNDDAAELIYKYGQRLRWACLGHLSEKNNTPEKALDTHRKIIGTNLNIFTASRYGCTLAPDL
jgi:phosphoribosyl 1,2-cyclic phosphodiesterase